MPAKTFTEPQPFANEDRPQIQLQPVESNQVKAIGYCADTKALAVTFTRGAGAIYHYADVERETFEQLIGAESIGRFFGERIKQLPFKKYRPEETAAA